MVDTYIQVYNGNDLIKDYKIHRKHLSDAAAKGAQGCYETDPVHIS